MRVVSRDGRKATPLVSVVINTYNRCRTLKCALASLRQLNYPRFEVVVVNGPSTDATEQVLAPFADSIKLLRCPQRSLSMSRNIGICAAAGEIIAFMDDDAVADPRWLDNLVAAYDDPAVAAVGGFVHDHTGYSYQCWYNIVDRFGRVTTLKDQHLDDQDLHNSPANPTVLSTIGTNTSFRASALRAIGGFDEAYMYYLDETDVCLRLMDAGHKIRIVPDAIIYHSYAASFARTDQKIPVTLYPAAYCRAYYTYRNGLPLGTVSEILDVLGPFEQEIRNANQWFRDNGLMTPAKEAELAAEIRRGMQDGARAALSQERALITPTLAQAFGAPFKPFQRTIEPADGRKLRICLITDGYPPENCGGVARWTADLAAAQVALGHEVHVVTLGENQPTVDYQDGVWVHRVVPAWQPSHPVSPPLDLPGRPWSAMLAVYDEVIRSSAIARYDIVAWHVWENLGLACLNDSNLTCALFIESAFGLIRPFKPQWQIETEYGREHVAKMVAGECYAFQRAPLVIAPSQTIVAEYEHLAGNRRAVPTIVIPLGTADPGAPSARAAAQPVTVLYVGRLENRKGIDLLLASIPELCSRFPSVRFVICGEDVAEDGDGLTPRTRFESQHAGADFAFQVQFTGKVSDEELKRLYANCDVFVAPSRFESFGLIFIEAMAHGKPVIALDVGGATEIVRHGVDGLLVQPNNVPAITEAIGELIGNAEFRAAAGRNARQRYLDRFTISQMATETTEAFRNLVEQRHANPILHPSRGLSRAA
jgi:hypothetical protein